MPSAGMGMSPAVLHSPSTMNFVVALIFHSAPGAMRRAISRAADVRVDAPL